MQKKPNGRKKNEVDVQEEQKGDLQEREEYKLDYGDFELPVRITHGQL